MDEHQPIDANEFVYRRIHRAYYQPGLPLPVQPAAFRPNQQDSTGLSVFRALFVQPQDALATVEAGKRNDYYIARLAVIDLHRLGLTVTPEPDPSRPRGHAVIPELSWQAYQADKHRLKEIQVKLARLAGAAIIHQPS
jgi:hypothetical protein